MEEMPGGPWLALEPSLLTPCTSLLAYPARIYAGHFTFHIPGKYSNCMRECEVRNILTENIVKKLKDKYVSAVILIRKE